MTRYVFGFSVDFIFKRSQISTSAELHQTLPLYSYLYSEGFYRGVWSYIIWLIYITLYFLKHGDNVFLAVDSIFWVIKIIIHNPTITKELWRTLQTVSTHLLLSSRFSSITNVVRRSMRCSALSHRSWFRFTASRQNRDRGTVTCSDAISFHTFCTPVIFYRSQK